MAIAPPALVEALRFRYRFERELGQGGMATVYLARDLQDNSAVAVKVIRPELVPLLGAERFAREIRITSRLQHAGILRVLAAGNAEGLPYYVIPYVEGESLAERLAREGPLPLADALDIARQIADALEAAHGQGFVHRDIKPGNILLTNGRAVLADFGLARAVDIVTDDRLTESGVVLGTPTYMSPEQSYGERIDCRSDLYSLGCVLFEMLSGRPPFTGDTPQAVRARHAADPVPSLRSVRDTVSPALERAIVKAMAKVPADRYATAAEFREALEPGSGAEQPVASLLQSLRDTLAARYEIQRDLAAGGMGVLFLARDIVLDRPVAIKVLRPDLASQQAAERFLREARVLARFQHPNIVQIHDAGQAAGLSYYVMDYVDGETLAERLRRGPLSPSETVELGKELLNALEAVHRLGVTHRDVKPSNIFLLEGRTILGDFGLAKAAEQSGTAVTVPGQRVGTPAYMPPEQGVGGEVTPRTDLYAVGMVLYEALSGRRWPIIPRPEQSDWSGVPEQLGAVLRRALAWAPEDRWPDADSFRQALAGSATGREGSYPTPYRIAATDPVPLLRAFTRRDVIAAVVLYLIAALLGARATAILVQRLAWPAWVPLTIYAAFLLGVPLVAGAAWASGGRAVRAGTGGSGSLLLVDGHRVPPAVRRIAVLRSSDLIGLLGLAVIALGLLLLAIRPAGPARASVLDPRRVAVLYFDDHSEGKELGHVAAGFTEALIQELSQVQGLRVISRNGVKRYRETGPAVDSIARQLEVGSVVEGSIARSGDSLRVTVDLVDGQSGLTLDSRAVSRPWGELFALQDDIADEVAGSLRKRLGVEIRRHERMRETGSVEAWELVRRAERSLEDYRPVMKTGDTAAASRVLDAADSLLVLAESHDRSWPEPAVRRGRVAQLKARLLSPIPDQYNEQWAARAAGHVERALKLRRDDPDALELRGTLRYRLAGQTADSAARAELFASAEADLRAAVEANPSQAGAWATLSQLLQLVKAEYAEAKQAAIRAYQEDAFLDDADDILTNLAGTSIDLGEYQDALRWAREGRRRFPDMVNWPAVELMVLVADRSRGADVDGAWRLVREINALLPPHRRLFYLPIAEMQVAAALARQGLPDSARAVIQRAHARFPEDPANLGYEESYAWLMLGERDRALQALSDYLEVAPHRRSYIAKDPLFEDLRDDPRFRALTGPGN